MEETEPPQVVVDPPIRVLRALPSEKIKVKKFSNNENKAKNKVNRKEDSEKVDCEG
jgi:hypothetical protein